ncbi:beta-1,3-glucan-binding protein-like isoform X2 [Frankliniella occidentalis]|uniref:Beta-1,3-glucan-binding protein-like isoform X2 n=1 Tax=Frankliniella occidentalis TaxID=133901 RepID=A0A9C6X0V3_FRAOC|nr:beta-1,3-glucan-binding protein-like isoform X2 [Frankliniella occidentalis]
MPCPQAHKAHRRSFPLPSTLPVLLLVLPALLPAAAGQTRQAGRGSAVRQVGYSVPTPLIEALSPRGLRATIPDEPGISLVRFHIGVNKPLSAQRLGTVNVEVSQPTDSGAAPLWTYEDRTTVLGAGDVLYFWLQVTLAGHTYERAGTYAVQDVVEMLDVVSAPVLSVPLAESAPPSAQRPQQRPPPRPPPSPEAAAEQPCTRSLTSVNGRLVCQGELLFLENFDVTDLSAGPWRHDVRIAGQPDFEFTTFTRSEANTYVVNGQLVIRPTLTDDVYGKDFVRTGKLRLENCTAGALESELCSRQARYGYILPPVLSGRISTRKTFSFRYGVIEVRAKLPSGDWIYPELWLLPREEAYGTGLKSGRVQLALARGNLELHHGGAELGLRRLEAAAIAAAPGPAGHEQGEQEQEAEEEERLEAAVPFHGLDQPTRFADEGQAPARPATEARAPPPTTSTTTTSTTTSTTTHRTTTTHRATTSTARSISAAPVPAVVSRGAATPAKPAAAPTRPAPTVPSRTSASTARPRATTARPTSAPTRKPSPTTAAARGVATQGHKPQAGSKATTSSPARETGTSAPKGGGPTGYQHTPTPPTSAPYRDWGDGDAAQQGGWSPRYVRSLAGYRGPLRKEVSRTELPGRPWSGGFHNYTLTWTPEEMIFSVDGVELGVVLLEETGGVFRTSADDPWHYGGKMAPFDREFYISLGLAVGGIHTFPEGVIGPNRNKKPWKNTAAKAMLSFWNAQADWYGSWSTDSALLVDFVRVTAL